MVALGSNLGDRGATLRAAVAALDAAVGVWLQDVSAVYESAPVGGPEQPDYLNAVALLRTSLAPSALLAVCHEIEVAHGRQRRERWGARTLDLDVISVGEPGTESEVISTDALLTLPHPRAHERAFVLAPWAQLDPTAELRLPDGALARVVDLLGQAGDRDGVRAAAVQALR